MLDIINYILAGFMVLVFCAWIMLIRTMAKDHAAIPKLGELAKDAKTPYRRVSVILAAKNEEKYIKRCLESLCAQEYKDLEIIAVDDASTDDTGEIIKKMSLIHENIIHVDAGPKPRGWVGKNWPCAQGRKVASGKLLFFTDADTVHSSRALSLAVAHMESAVIDAITVMPKILCLDFWTSVTMPIITVFLNTIYSAAKVNDPSKDTGYFYGSFFIIDAAAYDAVGGHSGVRGEIIEDGVLGRKVKNSKYKMLIVSGIDEVSAIWARDLGTLWNALKRLMVPIAVARQRNAIGITVGVGFLMFAPFVLFGYSLLLWFYGHAPYALLLASGASSLAMFAGAAVDSRILGHKIAYSAFAPLGGAMVTFGFLAGALVPNVGGVSWRGTKYTESDCKSSIPNT